MTPSPFRGCGFQSFCLQLRTYVADISSPTSVMRTRNCWSQRPDAFVGSINKKKTLIKRAMRSRDSHLHCRNQPRSRTFSMSWLTIPFQDSMQNMHVRNTQVSMNRLLPSPVAVQVKPLSNIGLQSSHWDICYDLQDQQAVSHSQCA